MIFWLLFELDTFASTYSRDLLPHTRGANRFRDTGHVVQVFSAHVVPIDYRAYIGFMVLTNILIGTILTLIVTRMKRFRTVTQSVENPSDFDLLPIKTF